MFRTFLLVLASLTLAVTMNAEKIRKPATLASTPVVSAISAEDFATVKATVTEIKEAVKAIPAPVQPIDYSGRLEKIEMSIAKAIVPPETPTFLGYDAVHTSWFLLIMLLIVLASLLISMFRGKKSDGAGSSAALILCLLLGANAASAAVVIDSVSVTKVAAGTATPISICTKSAYEDIRISGSGVTLESAAVVGDCVNATLKVDAAAAVGKRAIEAQETPTGAYSSTGSEVEITAPTVVLPTPVPPVVPPAKVAPVTGMDIHARLVLEGIACPSQTTECLVAFRKKAWGPVKGSSAKIGSQIRDVIRKEVTEHVFADDRFTKTTEAITALGDAIKAAPAAPSVDLTPITDRLGAIQADQEKLAGRVNDVSGRLVAVEGDMVEARNNISKIRKTASITAAAVVTGSKHDRCALYTNLVETRQIRADAKPPKGCAVK